ncbi:MAG: Tex family protein [Methanobacteriaceae archaeon]|nr:Tex family protein [Methanobacteriaceae archaeon]
MIDIEEKLSQEFKISQWQINAAITLIQEENTIPFIARYRKEATGGLDDETLRDLNQRLDYLQKLEDRKRTVLNNIEKQEKLTPHLEKKIEETESILEVDDIYRPYKQQKQTRASKARKKGLEKLAYIIYDQKNNKPIIEIAKNYLTKEVPTIKEAIQGAEDIIAEMISDKAHYRKHIRNLTIKEGQINSEARDMKETTEYNMYYEYTENISDIVQHRVLAINRGEKEKKLRVKIITPKEDILSYLEYHIIKDPKKVKDTTPLLKETIKDAYNRLIAPAIEREIRNILTDVAEDKSIKVFKKNLEQLLMQPPITNKVVLGWDPAYRTGCKLAVIDKLGNLLETAVVYPTKPQKRIEETKHIVRDLIRKYNVDIIALGNGTASRESEQIIIDIIKNTKVKYATVNESGASIYSASDLARKEFPNQDVTERGTISIARRLQDPLSELVKIDPQSIGVGQYQHDMDDKKLKESLDGVVEKAVNNVGVDLNTASASLLEHVAGITKKIATNIVEYRKENGAFVDRNQLLKVPQIGAKTFQQCAGFMRIYNPKNILDSTCVHPESYDTALALLTTYGYDLYDIRGSGIDIKVDDTEKLSSQLGIGEMTLQDIIMELRKPGRDPREDYPTPKLRNDVLDMEDLYEGMIVEGVVRNVLDFGAFVDIGVHQDGLVHKSELSDKKVVEHPLNIVNIGDIIKVKVLSVDFERERINLSMKL